MLGKRGEKLGVVLFFFGGTKIVKRCIVQFYRYFRSMESMVGPPHSSGDRVVVIAVIAIHDRVENG